MCILCNCGSLFLRDLKPLNKLIDTFLLLLWAVRKEENIAVFLSLIPYSRIPDPLLYPVAD